MLGHVVVRSLFALKLSLHMVPWAYLSSHPEQHLSRFNHFCGAHSRDRQTDQQTTLLFLHLASAAM